MTRRYAMTRIGAGDYLLPSNDAQTLWRIYSYEDGPAQGAEGLRQGTYWGAARFPVPLPEIPPHVLGELPETFLDGSAWTNTAAALRTRREAIEAALA